MFFRITTIPAKTNRKLGEFGGSCPDRELPRHHAGEQTDNPEP
jgi:hypothetical protein